MSVANSKRDVMSHARYVSATAGYQRCFCDIEEMSGHDDDS